MLDNIEIGWTDLQKEKHDIVDRYDSNKEIFNNAITSARRDLYAQLKKKLQGDYPGYDNTQLDSLADDIRDLPNEEYLKTRLVFLTIANIFEQNDLLMEGSYYRQRADSVDIRYYIDSDDSETVSSEEQVSHSPTVFSGR